MLTVFEKHTQTDIHLHTSLCHNPEYPSYISAYFPFFMPLILFRNELPAFPHPENCLMLLLGLSFSLTPSHFIQVPYLDKDKVKRSLPHSQANRNGLFAWGEGLMFPHSFFPFPLPLYMSFKWKELMIHLDQGCSFWERRLSSPQGGSSWATSPSKYETHNAAGVD